MAHFETDYGEIIPAPFPHAHEGATCPCGYPAATEAAAERCAAWCPAQSDVRKREATPAHASTPEQQ